MFTDIQSLCQNCPMYTGEVTLNLSHKCPEVIFYDLRVFLHIELI